MVAQKPSKLLGRVRFPSPALVPRGVAQSGSAPGWGPGGRRFKSCLPDYAKGLQRPAPWLRRLRRLVEAAGSRRSTARRVGSGRTAQTRTGIRPSRVSRYTWLGGTCQRLASCSAVNSWGVAGGAHTEHPRASPYRRRRRHPGCARLGCGNWSALIPECPLSYAVVHGSRRHSARALRSRRGLHSRRRRHDAGARHAEPAAHPRPVTPGPAQSTSWQTRRAWDPGRLSPAAAAAPPGSSSGAARAARSSTTSTTTTSASCSNRPSATSSTCARASADPRLTPSRRGPGWRCRADPMPSTRTTATHDHHGHDHGRGGHRHHDGDHGHSHGLVHESIKRSRDGVRAVLISLAVLGVAAVAQTR